jgi:hypothetical protein
MDVKLTRKKAKEGVDALSTDEAHRIEIDSRCFEVAFSREEVPNGRTGTLNLAMGGQTFTRDLTDAVEADGFLSFRFFNLPWGEQATAELVLQETDEQAERRITIIKDTLVDGEIGEDAIPDGGSPQPADDAAEEPEASDGTSDAAAVQEAFEKAVRAEIESWVAPYDEGLGRKMVDAGRPLVGELAWGGEEGQSCYTSPFYLALKAGAITEDQYDTLHYIMGPGALRLSPTREYSTEDCYPGQTPKPGMLALFVPPHTGNTPMHVTICTGNDGEILSLEPGAEDGDVGLLKLTTIESYLERHLADYPVTPMVVLQPFPYRDPALR